MVSSELWAEDYSLVLNDPGPKSISNIKEQTFSFNLVGPAKSISFKIISRNNVKVAILKVYGYRESYPTNKVPIAEYKDVEGGVFQYDIEGQGFSRIEITAKSGIGMVAELLNVRAFSPYYPYESNLGSAEYNSADASTSFTIDYYGTPNFTHSSYEDGDWDNDKFPVSISASGGKATVTVTYPHDEVGKHDAMIIISNGVFKTIPYKFSGTTTKANQTIAWTPPTELTVGDSHTLSATALGGAVSYAVTGDAVTRSGNTLTAVKEGTVTITASQAGNGNYNAAANVTHTITINKATPTVTAWPTIAAVTYGASLEQALVLVGGEASVAGTFAITDSYNAADVPNAGTHTYNVTFTPSETNKYNIVSGGTATLVVNKADQVIAWTATPPTEMTVGDSHTLSATAYGGAVAFAITGDAATLADNTLTAVQAGTVTITASQAGNGNYNAAANITHTITINKATPTVTAWPTIAAVAYGARLEQALVLVGGEASVAGTFAITDSYNAADVPNAGTHTYNVTFTPSKTNKYNVVSGGTATLTVNKANQTITWDFADCTLLPGQTLALDATSTCGAVSYELTGSAISVSGNTLTAETAGTATIKAVDDGNSNYNAVESPVYTVTVSESGYTRAVTNGNYGTICLPYGSRNYAGADFYEIAYAEIKNGDATGLYLDQLEEDAALVAGKPYIFKATADILIVTYEGAIVDDPVAGDAGLTGTLVDIPAGGVLVGNYIIAQNMFWDASAENWLNANRAYINKTILSQTEPKSPVPGRRRVSMGETGENAATGLDNSPLPMINSQKLIENGQLIIIRDGVKYNAQGVRL